MQGHPNNTDNVGRAKQGDKLQLRHTSALPKRSSFQATQEKFATALPASLEPEPSLAAGDKGSKAKSRRPQKHSSSAQNKSHSRAKKVSFAPGPLTAPGGGVDGHPVAEGRVAKPVRIRDGKFARGVTVTKKDILELDLPELLGNEQYQHSITKLKVRVGLLPSMPPVRPHVSRARSVAGRRPRPGEAAADMASSRDTGSSDTGSTNATQRKRRCGDS